MAKMVLQRVRYMPPVLEPGVLYVSEEFHTAAHLCACGCGAKIRTPLGPTEWSVEETRSGPTLWPSIGNWQLPCRSHYWIRRGEIKWTKEWTPEMIEAGRSREFRRRREYYGGLSGEPRGFLRRVWRSLKKRFKR